MGKFEGEEESSTTFGLDNQRDTKHGSSRASERARLGGEEKSIFPGLFERAGGKQK